MENKVTNTEKAILEAALIEFADKGLTGSRTIEIAERAGVTHAMLHYYFRTKEMLFEKVVNSKVDDICSIVLPALSDESLPLIDRIIKGMSLHYDFLKENRKLPSLLIGIFSSGSELAQRFTSLLREGMSPAIVSLQKELDKAYKTGEIDRIDAVMLISDIVSLNALPFVMWSLHAGVLGIDVDTEADFLQRKKEENIHTIIKRLQP